MKTADQTSPELTRVCDLLKGMRVVMLTTLDEAGELGCRPMTALEMDATGAIWFFTDARSTKLAQLRKVNLACADTDSATYLSLSGHGEIVADAQRNKALWSPMAKPWFPDGPDSENLVLLKFVPQTAELWDGPSSKMVRLFALAASIVAGKPVGLGEHDRFSDLSRST
jgi:general stress protein 26